MIAVTPKSKKALYLALATALYAQVARAQSPDEAAPPKGPSPSHQPAVPAQSAPAPAPGEAPAETPGQTPGQTPGEAPGETTPAAPAEKPPEATEQEPSAPPPLPDVEGLPPADDIPPLPDVEGLPPADDIPPLPDIEGLPPADDIPPLPDVEGLPPADDIPGPGRQGHTGRARATKQKRVGNVANDGTTVVRVRRKPRAVTSTRTSTKEAKRLPGTQGDVIRVIQSLPGVGRASFASGALLLWGASPDSSRVYVDGVPVPRLFHNGGFRGTLNGFFVKDLELVPGAYGADYGGATAGMVRVATAPLQGGTHGVLHLDVLDSSLAASTQVSKKLYVAAGYRQSYLYKLAPLVASNDALQYTLIPSYRDYQARIEYRISETSRLTVMAFGSHDRSSTSFTLDDPARERSSARGAGYNRVALMYTGQTSDGATMRLTAYVGNDQSSTNDAVGQYSYSLDSSALAWGLRASWLKRFGDQLRLHAGLVVQSWFTGLSRTGSLARPPREGDAFVFGQAPVGDSGYDRWNVHQVNIAPYVEMPMTLLNKSLEIIPGVRLAGSLTDVNRALPPRGDTPSHGEANLSLAIEPRLMANLHATDKLAFKVGGGVYHSPANPANLSAVFGTPTLGSQKALQAIAGGSYDFTKNLSLEVVGFVRSIDHYVGRNQASSLPPGQVLTQDGQARAFGGQATLRHRLANGFTGWLAYTLSRSEVRYHPTSPWVLSDYNQTHLFTAVGSYELGKGFSIGTRFRLITGLPRTPVVGRVYDSVNGDFQPVFGALNTINLPTITMLDARIDKTFKLGAGQIIVFIDVMNVLNRPPAEEFVYDPGYTQRSSIRGIPIVADFGIRGEL